MQVHPETVESTPSVTADRTQTTTTDPFAGRRVMSIKLTQTIYLIVGLIEGLLLIRFVLKALGANVEVGFAQLIYTVTGPLVAPFLGLFGTATAASGAALEPYTLLALVIYAVVGWVLARIVWLLFGETRSASATQAETMQTHLH